MTRMKIGGMVLTGVGAYLVLSKLISALRGATHDISDAMKWKAYYNCTRENPMPPGYTRRTAANQDSEDGDVVEDYPPVKRKPDPSAEALSASVANAVKEGIDALFEGVKARKTPLEPVKKPYTYKEYYSTKEKEYHADTEPYLITRKQFWEERPEYDKLTLNWYEPDDILTGDTLDEMIEDRSVLIGSTNVGLVFDNIPLEDPDIFYVRNDAMATDFEIVRFKQSYLKVTDAEETPTKVQDCVYDILMDKMVNKIQDPVIKLKEDEDQ